jgi:predicted TIM-barrel fold metal-dependent hydrolase
VDPIGIELQKHIGVDNMLWGNDYPHIEGCWPNSDRVIEAWGTRVNDADKCKLLGLNAARIFSIPVPLKYRQEVAA